jgi:uncharacterized protein DUF6340
MNTIDPAPITLSKGVQRIGIINRSLPSESNTTADKIDKILSAEGRNLDAEGSEAAILALMEQLRQNESLEEIVIIGDQPHLRKGLGVFPTTLIWNEIETLCEEYKVDAIFSLAFYDTDTKVSYAMTTMDLPNKIGLNIPIPAHEITLNTLVQNGWRVYDPHSKRVADELIYSDHVVTLGKGMNPVKAFEAIAGRKEAVLHQSKYMGMDYGKRLLPYQLRVTRDYFVRGTNNFKIAQRRAQTGDWQGAAELWEQETRHSAPKVAGRACYNMAISNEINGDLDTAMQWASKAYTDYEIKDALRYLNILKYRASQDDVLDDQLSR